MIDFTLNDIEKLLDRGFEKQAIMINTAFQNQKDHYDLRFREVRGDMYGLENKMDGLEHRMGSLEHRMDGFENRMERVETKLDRALYTDMTHLEARVRDLENNSDKKSV